LGMMSSWWYTGSNCRHDARWHSEVHFFIQKIDMVFLSTASLWIIGLEKGNHELY
jgi:hypothetical protein